MFHSKLKLLFLCPILALLAACGSHIKRDQMLVSRDFFASNPKVLFVQVEGLQKPTFNPLGAEGFLDLALIRLSTDSFVTEVEKVDAQPIVAENFFDKLRIEFSKRGATVYDKRLVITKEELKKLEEETAKHAPYDFRALGARYGVDYLLVVDPQSFGLVRNYYGFIPLGRPTAVTNIQFYLVHVPTNTLEGYYENVQEKEPIGDWDVEPDYLPLKEAVVGSLTNCLDQGCRFMVETW